MIGHLPFFRRWASLSIAGVILAGALGGCVAPPITTSARLSANATADTTKIHRVAVLPLDVEVSELSAGGMHEKRDDWTRQVTDNLEKSIARLTPFKPVSPPAPLPAADVAEVHALFRAITANQFFHGFFGPLLITSVRGPLVYQAGPMDALLDPAKSDAALVVFVRDNYSTGGRKAVAFFGALAGIHVTTGVTVSSAALVARDGTLLWMNHAGATSGDLRTQEGADNTVKALFVGLPSLAPAR